MLKQRVCGSAETVRGPGNSIFAKGLDNGRDGATEIFGNFRMLEQIAGEDGKRTINEERLKVDRWRMEKRDNLKWSKVNSVIF